MDSWIPISNLMSYNSLFLVIFDVQIVPELTSENISKLSSIVFWHVSINFLYISMVFTARGCGGYCEFFYLALEFAIYVRTLLLIIRMFALKQYFLTQYIFIIGAFREIYSKKKIIHDPAQSMPLLKQFDIYLLPTFFFT